MVKTIDAVMKMETIIDEYFYSMTIGFWEETSFYTLTNPEFIEYFGEDDKDRAINDTIFVALENVEYRNCSIIRSRSLSADEFFIDIFVNDYGEIIPHVNIPVTVCNVSLFIDTILEIIRENRY